MITSRFDLNYFLKQKDIQPDLLSAVIACFEELRSVSSLEALGVQFVLDSSPLFIVERTDTETDLIEKMSPWIETLDIIQGGQLRVIHCVCMWNNDMLPHFFCVEGSNPVFQRRVDAYRESNEEWL